MPNLRQEGNHACGRPSDSARENVDGWWLDPQAFERIQKLLTMGYAPAFVIHDWIFHMKNCQLGGHQNYDLKIAGTVMAEAIKTMMETGKTEKDALTVDLMFRAVTSPIAQNYWENGRCTNAPRHLRESRCTNSK